MVVPDAAALPKRPPEPAGLAPKRPPPDAAGGAAAGVVDWPKPPKSGLEAGVVDPAGWEAVLDAPPNRLVEAAGAEGVDVPGVVVVGVAPKENPPGFGAVDAAPVFAPPNRLPPVAPPVAEPAPNKPPEAGAAPGVDDPNRLVPDAG